MNEASDICKIAEDAYERVWTSEVHLSARVYLNVPNVQRLETLTDPISAVHSNLCLVQRKLCTERQRESTKFHGLMCNKHTDN
jgi:hypothetical protein